MKQVHDAGVLAGVSTHNPDYLARMEDAGWEADLYMACMYNMGRNEEETKTVRRRGGSWGGLCRVGPAEDDQTDTAISKPCLAFKILAAGRLSEDAVTLERAFQFAYSGIKPGDAAIVGMYPVFTDEVREDAELVRKYGAPS